MPTYRIEFDYCDDDEVEDSDPVTDAAIEEFIASSISQVGVAVEVSNFKITKLK